MVPSSKSNLPRTRKGYDNTDCLLGCRWRSTQGDYNHTLFSPERKPSSYPCYHRGGAGGGGKLALNSGDASGGVGGGPIAFILIFSNSVPSSPHSSNSCIVCLSEGAAIRYVLHY